MSVQMQQRRDTAANWTSVNPTLALGEIGHETDTNKSKIGDGVTAWASLIYWVDPTSAQDYATKNYVDSRADLVSYSQYGGF